MHKLTYDIVQDKEMAGYMEEILRLGGIDVKINESKPFYDAILGDIDGMLKYEIILHPNDFEKADILLTAALQKENFTTGHILNEYTDEELIAMYKNPEKQARLNHIAAKIILEKRGIKIQQEDFIEEQDDDNDAAGTDQSRSLPTWSKILLVIASVSGFGFIIMGIGGVIMGLFLNRLKVHNTKGQLYFCFDKSTREFGLALTLISALVFFVTWLFLTKNFSLPGL
jgi:hypothetical protein